MTNQIVTNAALPKNLVELLQFVPPCKTVRRTEAGDWICEFIQFATEEQIEGLKLRFGFRPGTVTQRALCIDRTCLHK